MKEQGKGHTEPTQESIEPNHWEANPALFTQVPSELLGVEDSETQTKIEVALTDYLTKVSALGLIGSIILGVDKNKSKAYFFCIFKEDTSIKKAADSRYSQLTRAGGTLERSLTPEIKTRVSYVNPSRLPQLQKACKDRHIACTSLQVDQHPVTPTRAN